MSLKHVFYGRCKNTRMLPVLVLCQRLHLGSAIFLFWWWWRHIKEWNLIWSLPEGLLWLDGDREGDPEGDPLLLVSSGAGGGASAVFWGGVRRESYRTGWVTNTARSIKLESCIHQSDVPMQYQCPVSHHITFKVRRQQSVTLSPSSAMLLFFNLSSWHESSQRKSIDWLQQLHTIQEKSLKKRK